MAGRRQALEYVRFLVDRVPGYERASLVAFGTGIGVRETRRVYGDYRLTRDDVLAGRAFPDAIGLCGAPIEDHQAVPTRSGSTCPTAPRWASPTGRWSSATPPTCSSPAAASRRPTMRTLRCARWRSAWRWARRPVRRRRWPSRPASTRATSRSAVLRDRLRADGAIVDLDQASAGRRMTFVRTVLGDIDPSELGVTYAHEHVIIDGGRPVLMEPDFDLGDVDAMAREVRRSDRAGTAGDRRRDALRRRSERRQARRPVASDRRARHRPDRPPPRPILRTRPLEPPCLGRDAHRPVQRRHHRRASTPSTIRGRSSAGPRSVPA